MVAALALATLLAACGGAKVVEPVAPGLPVIAFPDPPPPSLTDVPAAAMPAALHEIYAIKPDRRFIGAIAEIHRLVTGRRADTVSVHRRDGRWSIDYAGEHVGELRELSGFGEGGALLQGWATHVLEAHQLVAGAPAAEEVRAVNELLAQVAATQVAQALQLVDAGWARAHQAAWLPLAASGLTRLAIQVPTIESAADPLVARALAAVTLAQVAGQANAVAAEQALLAIHMGYASEAAVLGAALPAADPVRLLATRDTARLHAVAARPDATPLARHLYLLHLAALGDPARFRAWLALRRERYPTSGVLGAAVELANFDTDAGLVPIMSLELASELTRFTGHRSLLDRLDDYFFGRAPGRASWSRVLSAPDSTAGTRLADFENDLGALDSILVGPFLDGDLFRTYFRGQMHAAFERACIHYVDGLSSVRDAAEFTANFDGAPEGLWADATRWCHDRANLMRGGTEVNDLLTDLQNALGLSDPAVRHTVEDITERLQYLDARDVVVAHAVFQRLDGRPRDIRRLSQLASDQLRDVPLAMRLDARLLELARADYPALDVWYARFRGDEAGLRTRAADKTFDRGARFDALRDLLTLSRDTTATLRAFDALIAEDDNDWDVRNDYVHLLERARRPADAARVAKDWLAGHQDDRGFNVLFATIALARQYQRMGRPADGWALLEPRRGSMQLGVLQRSALIALDLHKMETADTLARLVVDRYPNSPDSRITLAQVRWAQDRYTDVVGILNDNQHPLSVTQWRDPIAPAFVRVFGHRPQQDGEQAFAALLASGAPANKLSALVEGATDSAYYPLALALERQLLASSTDEAKQLDMYRYVTAALGASTAQARLRARWSPLEARRQALSIYRQGLYDLLWTLEAEPDNGPEGSYYWLVRAMAWTGDPRRDPSRGAQLMAFYRRPDPRFYHLAGRVLMGLEPPETLLTFADSPHRRCEVSYYLGLKAISDRRYAEASDWLRIAVELHPERDWEVLWAKDLLTRWEGTGHDLSVAVPEIAAKRIAW